MENKAVKKKSNKLLDFFLIPEVGVILPIILIMVIATLLKPQFLTWKYLSTVLSNMAPIGFTALAEMIMVMVGEIDLSVGTCTTLAGCTAGYVAHNYGWPMIPMILVCLATGAVVGLVNGVLSSKIGITAWIVTLATQFICNGVAQTLTAGIPQKFDMPAGFKAVVKGDIFGLSFWFWFLLVGVLICAFIVNKTKFGYKLRAVGGNKEAALLAGIDVENIKFACWIFAGVLASIGGLVDILTSSSGSPTTGMGREFRAIICVNCGAIIAGGGSVYCCGLGIIMYHMVYYALQLCGPAIGIDTNRQLIALGLILILAVLLNTFRAKMKAKKGEN